MRARTVFKGLILAAGALPLAVVGQGVPAPYTMRLQTFAVSPNVTRPVLLRSARDGSHRIFVIQQTGIIKVFQPGSNVSTTFIDLTSRIVPVGGLGDERGLLGLAFHPDFTHNGKFYCFFNRASDSANTLAEYTTTTGNGQSNTADPSTERILFAIPDPFPNHNGGNLEFGPDGYLYIGTGDGGSGNDPGNRAQNPSLLLGKMLRIDVNGTPYAIPPTNPFVGQNTQMCPDGSAPQGITCQELWTIGMRNPWRWSFDRGTPGVPLWIADVGQGAIEEVDVVTQGGGNYGWRVYEGDQCTGLDPSLCTVPPNPIYIMPLFEYTHIAGRCAITGGYVYRGKLGSLPVGGFVHGDYCSGEIWSWNGSSQVLLQDTPQNITSFGEDEDGEIYVCYGIAQIDKLTRAKASADVDGDLKTDLSVYRPSNGVWYSLNSSNNSIRQLQFGIPGDIPVPEDYDGDNITDVAIFRPSNGNWAILRSSDGTATITHWGDTGDIPAAGDYDGDAKADLTVFRPSDGYWYTKTATTTTATRFGASTDKPVAGDYDGDGKYDVTVWRPSDGTWYRLSSIDGSFSAVQWGTNGDITTPGDYDGDGKIDQSVFRPSNGVWNTRLSSTGALQAIQWGVNGDTPVVGDYDGDGKDDIGVFRPSNGTWYVLRSSNGSLLAVPWGTAGDIPIPSVDNP